MVSTFYLDLSTWSNVTRKINWNKIYKLNKVKLLFTFERFSTVNIYASLESDDLNYTELFVYSADGNLIRQFVKIKIKFICAISTCEISKDPCVFLPELYEQNSQKIKFESETIPSRRYYIKCSTMNWTKRSMVFRIEKIFVRLYKWCSPFRWVQYMAEGPCQNQWRSMEYLRVRTLLVPTQT